MKYVFMYVVHLGLKVKPDELAMAIFHYFEKQDGWLQLLKKVRD